MHPTHVVVDTTFGTVYYRNEDGSVFTEETANTFAEGVEEARRVRARRTGEEIEPAYIVFKLVRPTKPVPGWWEG
jgi:hypothetical protein